jgi:hypothetical protein
LGAASSAAGTTSLIKIVSDETIVNPKVTEVEILAFLEDPSRHAMTESEAHIEAAHAVPILKRGLKSMN